MSSNQNSGLTLGCNWDDCPYETSDPVEMTTHRREAHDHYWTGQGFNRSPPGREPLPGELGAYENLPAGLAANSGATQPEAERTQRTASPPPPNQSAHDAANVRLPFGVEIGPVMRVGDVLAAKPGDPRPAAQSFMANPTVGELYGHLKSLLRGPDGEVRPVFGPERPPAPQ